MLGPMLGPMPAPCCLSAVFTSKHATPPLHPQDFGAIRVSTLTLVDLAGSERIAKTGAEGQRMKEVRGRLRGRCWFSWGEEGPETSAATPLLVLVARRPCMPVGIPASTRHDPLSAAHPTRHPCRAPPSTRAC